MKIVRAEYRCFGCGHEFKGMPGLTPCPKCGHLYVKWMNYEEWRRDNPITEVR